MKTFFKVITALLAAVGAVLLTMKIIDAISRSDKDNKRIALFKGNLNLSKPGKRTKLSKTADKLSDEIADYRFEEDDDLYADLKDTAEYTAEALSDLADELIKEAQDICAELTDSVEDILDDIGEAVQDAVEESDISEILDGISEDDLDKLLGGE